MAYSAWINIPLTHGRSGPVFRLWDAVAHLLTGGSWTVVDNSTGGVPTWASDTDPADGAWVVVQSESAWADATKLQVFLGYRATTGNLAGFGSKAAGLWCAFSPDGQWNAGGFFGASAADWRNGSLLSVPGATTACTMGLILTSGASGRAGSLYLLTRVGTGANLHTVAVVAVIPPTGLPNSKARTALLTGAPSNASSGWLASTGWYLKATNTALSGYSGGFVVQHGDYGLDRDGSMRVEADFCSVKDASTATSFGMLDLVYRCSASDGDVSVDGTRWVWEGYSWPREAARDGVWG